ncbi:MAG TPA: hydrogen gas-evolving membrane-bound hydrogenase subunit E [Flavobacterium sp.]|nr:hydrogen gas-evolving membrane-bound hydrogenase subunit E [Flavobacterium sp.]
MLTILILIFLIAFSLLFFGNYTQSKHYKFLGLIPLSLFAYFVVQAFHIHQQQQLLFEHPWIPSLGITMDFKLDGLSLLFSLLITGIGTLIFFYAAEYLKHHPYINRFYCYLTVFMGSMLGLVLSDNLISLFIFWELTSISSFFLIGFNNEDEVSQKSALTALGITGLGGFLLLAGFIVLHSVSETYSINEMLTSSKIIRDSGLFPVLLFLIFGGAFTKSAQFPFHFWLPKAMAAPTPVSAYLHSATMVKAGIYILARFSPILNDGFLWHNTLMVVGGVTMFYGAFHSIIRSDMKAILAYSTISALGIIVFLLGIGTELALYAAMTFIVVHALYKAALFLVTGIVDHATHSRDIYQLSGLRKVMPLVFTASLIAALSSAGIPLTFGFISKDLIYEATLALPRWAIWITAIAVLTNIFLAASGFMAGIKPFLGKLPSHFSEIKRPSPFLWIPVLLLSMLTLLFGLAPFLIDEALLKFAFEAVGNVAATTHLELWHGFGLVVLLSGITIVIGLLLFLIKTRKPKHQYIKDTFSGISPEALSEISVEKIRRFAFYYTRFFQNGYLRNYLLTIVVFIIILVGYRLFTAVPLEVNTSDLSDFRIYELTIFIMTVVAIFFTILTKSRLTAIASLGIVGYCISLIFVFYGAPDLAMTQFTIDTLTVVLFVLVLFKLPPFLSYKNKTIVIRDIIVSAAFGLLITIITLQALVSPATKETSRFFAENAYTLAKGKNIVNVILVDFRGIDTMIESLVLAIAALGVYSLLKYSSKNEEADKSQ